MRIQFSGDARDALFSWQLVSHGGFFWDSHASINVWKKKRNAGHLLLLVLDLCIWNILRFAIPSITWGRQVVDIAWLWPRRFIVNLRFPGGEDEAQKFAKLLQRDFLRGSSVLPGVQRLHSERDDGDKWPPAPHAEKLPSGN